MKSDPIRLHHRSQRDAVPRALDPHLGRCCRVELAVGGNRGEDRAHVRSTRRYDGLERNRSVRLVELDVTRDRIRKQHGDLVGSLAERIRDISNLLLQAGAVHMRHVR